MCGEAANSLVRERIIASDETDQAWNAEPVFTIRAVDEAALSSASYLADTIVKKFLRRNTKRHRHPCKRAACGRCDGRRGAAAGAE